MHSFLLLVPLVVGTQSTYTFDRPFTPQDQVIPRIGCGTGCHIEIEQLSQPEELPSGWRRVRVRRKSWIYNYETKEKEQIGFRDKSDGITEGWNYAHCKNEQFVFTITPDLKHQKIKDVYHKGGQDNGEPKFQTVYGNPFEQWAKLCPVEAKPGVAYLNLMRKNFYAFMQSYGLMEEATEKYNNKDYEGSILDLTKAISINPKLSRGYHNRGASKQGLNQHEGAIEDFDKAIELEKDTTILYHYYNNRAWSKYNIGKLKEGLIDADKSIELNQKYKNSFHTRGHIRHDLGDMKGACSDMEKSLSLGSKESKEWFKEEGKYCSRLLVDGMYHF